MLAPLRDHVREDRLLRVCGYMGVGLVMRVGVHASGRRSTNRPKEGSPPTTSTLFKGPPLRCPASTSRPRISTSSARKSWLSSTMTKSVRMCLSSVLCAISRTVVGAHVRI